jgi:hypothetical protein
MFNNVKYKIKEEVIDPVLNIEESFADTVSSDLRSSSERVGARGWELPLSATNPIKELFTFYKPLTILGKIIYLPFLIKNLIINLKTIYNEQ